MKYDERAASAKRRELRQVAMQSQIKLSEETLHATLAAFVQVTAPEKAETEIDSNLGWITMHSFPKPNAVSQKPGNLLLNWRKLMDIVPDISLAGLGAVSLPDAMGIVIAGLYIWNKLWSGSTEVFSEEEAVTMLALWKNRDSQNRITEPEGFSKTNVMRSVYSLPPLCKTDFSGIIDRLVALGCMKLENGVLSLRESVCIKYP